MAQTTTATTTSAATVEIKIAAGSYVSIGGSTNLVEQVTIERVSGAKGTLDGGEKIVQAGRQVATMVNVVCLYTETIGEALKLTLASIKAGNAAQLQWKPTGSSGETFNTAPYGKIVKLTLPVLDASAGEPAEFTVTVMCGGVETTFDD